MLFEPERSIPANIYLIYIWLQFGNVLDVWVRMTNIFQKYSHAMLSYVDLLWTLKHSVGQGKISLDSAQLQADSPWR